LVPSSHLTSANKKEGNLVDAIKLATFFKFGALSPSVCSIAPSLAETVFLKRRLPDGLSHPAIF